MLYIGTFSWHINRHAGEVRSIIRGLSQSYDLMFNENAMRFPCMVLRGRNSHCFGCLIDAINLNYSIHLVCYKKLHIWMSTITNTLSSDTCYGSHTWNYNNLVIAVCFTNSICWWCGLSVDTLKLLHHIDFLIYHISNNM